MNKFGMVLGMAAVATLAGCKDPDYKYGNESAAQNEVKPAEAQPAVVETTTVKCHCPPGTRHTSPCTCGAPDCQCLVEAAPIATEPVPAAPVAKPVAPAAEYTTYVVQKGDVLSKIAQKFSVKLSDLRKANPRVKKDIIWVGMRLRLPGQMAVGEPAPRAAARVPAATLPKVAKRSHVPYTGATKEYVIKAGDSLGSIAYGNGITIRQLKELNGLKKDTLRVGRKLKVPAEKVVAPKKAEKGSAKKAAAAKKDGKKPEVKAAAPDKAEEKKAPEAAPEVKAAPAEKPAESAAAPAEAKPAEKAAAPAEKPAPATTTYVVQEGDDMTSVTIRWGVTAAAIRELNNLPDDAKLTPGQIIKLPADTQQ